MFFLVQDKFERANSVSWLWFQRRSTFPILGGRIAIKFNEVIRKTAARKQVVIPSSG